jgi:hypothetical protein
MRMFACPVSFFVDDFSFREHFKDHELVMGLDANTYKKHDSKWQGVDDFAAFLAQKVGLSSSRFKIQSVDGSASAMPCRNM